MDDTDDAERDSKRARRCPDAASDVRAGCAARPAHPAPLAQRRARCTVENEMLMLAMSMLMRQRTD